MIVRNKIALTLILLLLSVNFAALAHKVELTRKGKVFKTFKTIQPAIDEVKPGDVIKIYEGVYHEFAVIENKNGTASQPITIKGIGNVVIDVADPALQKPGNNRWSKMADGSYETEVAWTGDAWRAFNTWVTKTKDETLLASYAKEEHFQQNRRGSGTMRGNGDFMTATKVRIKFTDNTDPNNTGLNIGVAEAGFSMKNSAYWNFDNLKIKHAGFAGILLKNEQCHHITCTNLLFQSSSRGFSTNDFDKGGSHMKIINCTVKNDLGTHKNWNSFYSYTDTRTSPGQGDSKGKPSHGFGILLYKCDSSEVANCVIDGQWDGGHINGKNSSIHHTIFKNCTDDAIELETWGSENFRFYNNIISDCWGAISVGSNPRGPLYVYNNSVNATRKFKTEKVEKPGYCIKFGSDFANATENIKFYHNTFIGEEIIHVWDKKSQPEKYNNIEFVNNIFYAVNKSDGINNLWNMVPCNKGNTFISNVFNRAESLDKIKRYCPANEQAGVLADMSVANITRASKKALVTSKGSAYVQKMKWPM